MEAYKPQQQLKKCVVNHADGVEVTTDLTVRLKLTAAQDGPPAGRCALRSRSTRRHRDPQVAHSGIESNSHEPNGNEPPLALASRQVQILKRSQRGVFEECDPAIRPEVTWIYSEAKIVASAGAPASSLSPIGAKRHGNPPERSSVMRDLQYQAFVHRAKQY
jgi:hypothetical protein